jgi:hydrogenase maturation protease
MEVGIGGIHLVQELLDGADALVVVDAVDIGRDPGAVVTMEPDIRDLVEATTEERRDALADMHYATPDRALLLAKALDVLPSATVLIGCQVGDPDGLGQELSPVMEAALDAAVAEVRQVVTELGVPWA